MPCLISLEPPSQETRPPPRLIPAPLLFERASEALPQWFVTRT
jgi:hypothetical protein